MAQKKNNESRREVQALYPHVIFLAASHVDVIKFARDRCGARVHPTIPSPAPHHPTVRLPSAFREKLYFLYRGKFGIPGREYQRMLAARVLKLVSLRRKARADRRLAIVLFNFPPNAGAVGTAAWRMLVEVVPHTNA